MPSGRETICERFGGHIGVDAPGGYAEFAVLPARNLARIPDAIPVVEASVLANAIGTPYHPIVVRMNIAPGDRLVITGAGGGVGLHAVQIQGDVGSRGAGGRHRSREARTVPDALGIGNRRPDQQRPDNCHSRVDGRSRCRRSAGTRRTRHDGFDTRRSGERGKDGGLGSQTGGQWTIDPGDIYRNEWEIKRSRNVSIDELRTVIDLVGRGIITPIIDQTGPLEDAQRFHDRVASGSVIGRDILVP